MNTSNPLMKEWLGKAVCTLNAEHPQFQLGYRGAIFVFAIRADTLTELAELISTTCLENKLEVIGFEDLYCRAYMDREPTEYEASLIERLPLYSVQFKDIHFYKHEA